MKVRRLALAAFSALSLCFAACSDDNQTASSSPSNNAGGTAAQWASITEKAICFLEADCPGKEGFTINASGRYLIGEQDRGALEASELETLTTQANEVASLDLPQPLSCDPTRPGGSSAGGTSFIPDGRTLFMRASPDAEEQILFDTSTEGGTCVRGDAERILALERFFNGLMRKYDPAGGSNGGGTVCTQVFVYGLVITVRDGSGNPVTDATAVLSEGSYSETMEPAGEPGVYQGAGERAGTYTLQITAPGFEPHDESNLRISEDECHVIPVRKDITLQRPS